MKLTILIALLIAVSLATPPQSPIIGIFTQWDDTDEPKDNPFSLDAEEKAEAIAIQTYIAASYVKFIEMSGAQVVPIYGYSSESAILEQLSKVNGVLFPGGGEAINIANKWTKNAQVILNYAIEQNKKGNTFPVWGTCLGFQLLAYLTSGLDSKAISAIRGSTAIIQTIQFTGAKSYIFEEISDDVRTRLTKGVGITYYNNKYGVTPAYFASNKNMTAFWNVIATTTTAYSDEEIAVLEGKDYPIYAVQFHPEKNLFEWKVYADRSAAGAELVQTISNKFVEKARQNKNRYASLEEYYASSIYQFRAEPTKMSFTRIYRFKEDK